MLSLAACHAIACTGIGIAVARHCEALPALHVYHCSGRSSKTRAGPSRRWPHHLLPFIPLSPLYQPPFHLLQPCHVPFFNDPIERTHTAQSATQKGGVRSTKTLERRVRSQAPTVARATRRWPPLAVCAGQPIVAWQFSLTSA